MSDEIKKAGTVYCEYCEDEKFNYKLVKEKYTHKINGTVYEFYEYVAYCPDCGEPLDVPGLIDINVSYMDKQYREKEKIISVKDITKCLYIYNFSKDTFAKLLGIDELIINGYFKGQIPSKEHSDKIKDVRYSASLMDEYLEKNKAKISRGIYIATKYRIKALKYYPRVLS